MISLPNSTKCGDSKRQTRDEEPLQIPSAKRNKRPNLTVRTDKVQMTAFGPMGSGPILPIPVKSPDNAAALPNVLQSHPAGPPRIFVTKSPDTAFAPQNILQSYPPRILASKSPDIAFGQTNAQQSQTAGSSRNIKAFKDLSRPILLNKRSSLDADALSPATPTISLDLETPAKSEFLKVFENIYESQRYIKDLREQTRRSTLLLQTLQASGQMIEGLVKGHFMEMQSSYAEKMGCAFTDLNRRLVNIERKLGLCESEDVGLTQRVEHIEIALATQM